MIRRNQEFISIKGRFPLSDSNGVFLPISRIMCLIHHHGKKVLEEQGQHLTVACGCLDHKTKRLKDEFSLLVFKTKRLNIN